MSAPDGNRIVSTSVEGTYSIEGKTPIFGTVTINPSLNGMSIVTQITKTFSVIQNMMDVTELPYHYCYELTKQGNIHYHFLIWCDDSSIEIPVIIDSYKRFRSKIGKKFYNLFGFSKIEVCKDTKRVIDYIMKDVIKTEQIIRRTTKKVDFLTMYPVYNNDYNSRITKTVRRAITNNLKAYTQECLDLDQEIV